VTSVPPTPAPFATPPVPVTEHASAPPTTARRVGTAAFLFFATLIVLDATPRFGVIGAIAEAIDPVMDVTGLWQGPWNLFAPDVDKTNVRVSADIVFTGQHKTEWRSPDWNLMAPWERFISFRHQEYVDNIRQDSNSGGWTALARYLAGSVGPRGGGRVLRVTLRRHWATIPSPRARELPAKPYVEFADSYEFHRWRPPRRR
jgi:hypothetical protein